jgi:hypothetical protein
MLNGRKCSGASVTVAHWPRGGKFDEGAKTKASRSFIRIDAHRAPLQALHMRDVAARL